MYNIYIIYINMCKSRERGVEKDKQIVGGERKSEKENLKEREAILISKIYANL